MSDTTRQIPEVELLRAEVSSCAARVLFLEEELGKSRVELENLFNATVPMIVIDLDRRVLKANDPYCEYFDVRKEDVIGKSCSELMRSPHCMRENCQMKLVLEGRSRVEYQVLNNELASGRTISYVVTAMPMLDVAGRIIGISKSFIDITDRKIADEQIAIFRKLAEASGQGFCMCELNGCITYVNPTLCRMVGDGRPFDALGKSISSYYPEEMRAKVEDVVIPAAIRDGQWIGELALERDGGEVTRTLENYFLIRDEDGVPIYIANVVTDITERIEAEEELRRSKDQLELMNQAMKEKQAHLIQSEKMASIGQLAAGVAHEINNPIGFIMSNFSTLADYMRIFKLLLGKYTELSDAVSKMDGLEVEIKTVLEDIEKIKKVEDVQFVIDDVEKLIAESSDGSRRLKEIVQTLRSFTRVDEASLKDANINECLETTLKIVWNELKYKCTVTRDFAELPVIRCYPGQLNQVFMNLLVNSAQAIPEKGDVIIKTSLDGNLIKVAISDTGTGISQENMNKLFSPFFTTKPQGKGTGLGLSISYGIIQSHGGTIDVSSVEGKGTTFTISLPINRDSA